MSVNGRVEAVVVEAPQGARKDSDMSEQVSASRVVDATPAEVFAMLSDPREHRNTEPGDWVRDSWDAEQLTEVGQIFGMHMHSEQNDSPYEMLNEVFVLEQDRAIGWKPGRKDDDGNFGAGGWSWRYDLEPVDGGTKVTITYDWSGAPADVRERIPFPPFADDFLDRGLESLAARVAERRAA